MTQYIEIPATLDEPTKTAESATGESGSVVIGESGKVEKAGKADKPEKAEKPKKTPRYERIFDMPMQKVEGVKRAHDPEFKRRKYRVFGALGQVFDNYRFRRKRVLPQAHARQSDFHGDF